MVQIKPIIDKIDGIKVSITNENSRNGEGPTIWFRGEHVSCLQLERIYGKPKEINSVYSYMSKIGYTMPDIKTFVGEMNRILSRYEVKKLME